MPVASIPPSILRIWRLMALVCAVWLLHLAAEKQKPTRPATISVDQARRFFPDAARVSFGEHENSPEEVLDQNGRLLGFVAKTSPQADSIIGYAGPNNVLIALNRSGRVVGLNLISSGDTDAHVGDVNNSETFWKQFVGWSPSHEPTPVVEGVSGSTLTSLGIAEAIQKRLAGRIESLRFPEPITMEEVRGLFPSADNFGPDQSRNGWHTVKNSAGEVIGFVVRTSPYSDFTRGHSGPTESLVAVAPDAKKLLGIRVRRSYDTDDYVDSVRDDSGYLQQLIQFDVDQWAKINLKQSGLEGVSGATETSFAVAEGLRRRFAAEATAPKVAASLFKTRDWALLGIVVGSLMMSFTELRGKRFVRLAWQAALIGIFGLWYGDLLSLSLLVGWARNGLAWQIAPSLVLLAAVALLVPWTTRRQVYCHQLCPHGAAQEWLGNFPKLHVRIPPRLEKYLRFVPAALLGIAFIIALSLPRFDLASLEPFDAWAMRGTVLAATIIALAGLVASLFVPMAYCRFGCPTGALLKFIRSTGSADRYGLRDSTAIVFLLAGAAFVFSPATAPKAGASAKAAELRGNAFGTVWSVKLRNPAQDTAPLQQTLSGELERIESLLSHWRTNSATSRFNAMQTTQAIEMPDELVQLVARAIELSRASDGAFDITVAPLVQAWGFGPNGSVSTAPLADDVARLRSFTGWQKLNVNTNAHTLQKSHPQLQIDLGAILQGYAADRLSQVLDTAGSTEYLIDIGGELRARGEWRVAVENPERSGQPLRVLILKDGSLATSGTYRAKQTDGKKQWSHFINPATGEPIQNGTTLVAVLHPSAALADAWATTLLVVDKDRAKALARTHNLSLFMLSAGEPSTVNFPPDAR